MCVFFLLPFATVSIFECVPVNCVYVSRKNELQTISPRHHLIENMNSTSYQYYIFIIIIIIIHIKIGNIVTGNWCSDIREKGIQSIKTINTVSKSIFRILYLKFDSFNLKWILIIIIVIHTLVVYNCKIMRYRG